MSDPQDPKARQQDIAKFLEGSTKRREEIRQAREQRHEEREQQKQVSEAAVREGVAQEEKFEEEHEKRLMAFRKQEEGRKKEVEEFQRKKREEEERMLKRKEEEKKVAEEHKQYLIDMRKAGALRMRKEQKKQKSMQVEREMRAAADAEAYHTQLSANAEEARSHRRITEEARKRRGDVDAWEAEEKKLLAEDTRHKRAVLDTQEREAKQSFDREEIRKQMVLRGLPPGVAAREEERLKHESEASKQKMEKDFQRKHSQIEVDDRKALGDITTKAKWKRDTIAAQERQEISTLEESIRRKKQQAGFTQKHKHTEAHEEAERILNIKPGEEIK